MIKMLRNFDICIGCIVRSSVRGLMKSLVLFKNWVVVPLLLIFVGVLYVFWVQIVCQIYTLPIFRPFCTCLDDVFL